ncbi:uncharacterized protein LOC112127944 [Cimex lectularius]|uniref:Uncharacterized protein n=1 Tax=Cimex lectularius TaxID=79782 RepID=A0A8I6SLB1_CIMLE|nr:uncharacterized protein LOC112127944 [Cimex lectularius]
MKIKGLRGESYITTRSWGNAMDQKSPGKLHSSTPKLGFHIYILGRNAPRCYVSLDNSCTLETDKEHIIIVTPLKRCSNSFSKINRQVNIDVQTTIIDVYIMSTFLEIKS